MMTHYKSVVLMEKVTGKIESFLDAVSMMNINIQIHYTWMIFQKFQNCHGYIIYITKT